MKFINAVVKNNFKFDGEAEIIEHPSEGVPCIKQGDKFYSPTIVWMEYHPEGDPESENGDFEEDGVWIELDSDEENELISETYSEDIELKEISEDELDEFYEEN